MCYFCLCFRYIKDNAETLDDLNEKIMSTINASGKLFFTQTKLNGKFVYTRDYETTMVSPNDQLEFIHPNFGG